MPTVADLEQMSMQDVHKWVIRQPFVGKGNTRTVFAFTDNVVIKATNHHRVASRIEAATWASVAGTAEAGAFAAVVASAADGSWLLMERAERHAAPEQIAEFDAMWPDLRKRFKVALHDVAVMSDGRLCVIDYHGVEDPGLARRAGLDAAPH